MSSSHSLTHKTASGAFWTAGVLLVNKPVAFIAGIILAWLLTPEDFGLVAQSGVVAGMAAVIQQAGIREVLIRRYRRFHLWATSGFWIALVSGLLSSLIMVAAAWPASLFFNEPRLIPLVLITALTPVLHGLGVIPNTVLMAELRFSLLARIDIFVVVGQMISQIILASLGFGAYSFVLPGPVFAIARSALCWYAVQSPLHIHRRLHIRRWKYLIGDSLFVFLSAAAVSVINVADVTLLGRFHPSRVVGLYNFALQLSAQSLNIFGQSLAQVLLPALSHIQHDVERQFKAFIRASKLLVIVGFPFCFLQAAAADPVVRLIFPDKWLPAIPVLQVLSIGMAFRMTWPASRSLLQAQGRFQTYFIASVSYAVALLVLAAAGAILGEALGVAIAVSVFNLVVGPLDLALGIKPAGGKVRHVFAVFAPGALISALAAAVAWFIGSLMPAFAPTWLHQLTQISVITLVFTVIYIPLIRVFAPDACAELRERLQALRRRSLQSDIASA